MLCIVCVVFCCASVFERLLQVCCFMADDFQLDFVSSGGQKDTRPGVTSLYSDQTLPALWCTVEMGLKKKKKV